MSKLHGSITPSTIGSMDTKLSFGGRVRRFLKKSDNYADAPPDGGITAWLQVLGCFLIFMNVQGICYTFGVFQVYYELVKFPAHSSSSISWIGSLQNGLTFIVGILSGPLFDKGYYFPVLVVGSIGLPFSFMMLSISEKYWQTMLCQGILSGICTGLLYIPSISQMPLYFTTKKGRAIGLVLSGAPIGGIVYPLIFRYALQSHGFGWATRIIGFLTFALQMVAIILIKPLTILGRPKKEGDKTILKDKYYTTFLVGAFIVCAGILVPYFDVGAYYVAKIDPNLDSAFYALLVLNAAHAIARISITSLVDFGVGAETLINICIVVLIPISFGWIGATTKSGYYAFLIFYGFFSGGPLCLPALEMPFLSPRPEVFATRLGIVYFFVGIGFLISAPIANSLNHGPGDFKGAQIWTGATACAGLPFAVYASVGARRNRKAAQKAQLVAQQNRLPLEARV